MVNLLKKGDWVVIFVKNSEVVNERFTTIELASDFLLKMGIDDDGIDDAIIDMHANEHSRAVFGKNGNYSHTERD